jgi:hypothetical protein
MFKKSDIKFKAQIRIGGSIGQDFGYGRWPTCKAPKSEGGGNQAKDPEMVFNATMEGDWFDLTAIGYGEQPDYGNGSIHVRSVADLIIAPEDRERIIKYLRSKKQGEVDKAGAALASLEAELATIT